MEYQNNIFDDIRPYYDSEISAAMSRIVESPYFPKLASYVFPGSSIDEIKHMISSIDNISDFQYAI